MLGIFDSGSGGLSVARALFRAFPDIKSLYLGDHARAPYGDRDEQEIVTWTRQACDWLFAQGCDHVLLACNTASSIAHAYVKDDRIIDIVTPTQHWLEGQTGVGVLATQATVRAGVYADLVEVQQACPAWVTYIEQGGGKEGEARQVVADDVQMLFSSAQEPLKTVLLACTHFPAFHHLVKEVVPEEVSIMDQGDFVVEWIRQRHNIIRAKGGQKRFFTTGNVRQAEYAARQAFDMSVDYTRMTIETV